MAIIERAVHDTTCPPVPARRQRQRRWGASTADGLMGVALLAGPANVVMQLGRPGVAYGVMESRVESGRIDRHPVKRARTTFTYLAVAGRGTDQQKAAFRRAVNRAHAQVHSTDESPVKYNAFDKNLQLWVAACLYKGSVDIRRIFVGEIDDETADQHYRDGITLATTLQVTPEMWPADRVAFDKYWAEQLDQIHIDDATREFLYPIAVGLFAVCAAAMHGSIFLYLKTEGALQERIHGWMWRTFFVFLAAYVAVTGLTLLEIPHATDNFARWPAAWIVVGLNVLAIANIPRAIHQGKPGYAFVSSCCTIAALVFLFGMALFPHLVVSTGPGPGLTIENAASSRDTLGLMAIIAAIGMPFVLTYTGIVYWVFRGKVKLGKFSY